MREYDSLEEGTVKFARKVREIPVLDLGFRICFQFWIWIFESEFTELSEDA